ncbi:MAG: glycosyltransferase [Candidatus Paceibacterota bacterium]|jgi:glycosyltransferase involved in cell wall biosynthesis
MKVLHIIPTYLPSINSRGVIDAIHFLNKELVRVGVEVSVYTTNLDGAGGVLDVPLGREVAIDGVKVFYFESSFPKYWQYSYEMQKCLANTIATFDVVHITSVFLAQSTLGAYYARKFKKPYIITPHGSLMKKPLSMNPFLKRLYVFFLEKRNIQNAVMHFTTEIERNEFLETGLRCVKTIVVPNAFEAKAVPEGVAKGAFRKKAGVSNDIPIILFLGRLSKIKGIDTLIPAFADVLKKEPSAMLVLAGPDDGGYVSEIKDLISLYKIEDNTYFTGMVDGIEKQQLFLDSTIFVAPSYSENFGMAIVEAMHYHLPVIVSEGVGISPMIARGSAGMVIKKTREELVTAMLRLMANEVLRREMGSAGAILVDKEFLSKSVAQRFLLEYNRL